MTEAAERAAGSDGKDPFVAYYEAQSVSSECLARSERILQLMLRVRRWSGQPAENLVVGDIGCNAGSQSFIWARRGHRVRGLDINEPLLEIARGRARELGLAVDFDVGSATSLPWDKESVDICLMPELLEHVADWESCLGEAVRVLRPGGIVFLSTTNRLCPRQLEFDLPLYSWYPARLKRHFERLAVTTRPDLVSHASFPAVNWFTPYELRRWLEARGFQAWDHLDWIDTGQRGALVAMTAAMIRRLPPLRFLAHLATPYSMIIGMKKI